ncbi:MAG: HPr family phosphocarrier protein, partial [Deltaproteobacteria bacterium]|nr:HPr family phosphocarrier protein [Deltaproteobacteria bacterium]
MSGSGPGRKEGARTPAAAPRAESSCLLEHRPGLHVRAASVFVRTAQRFRAEVRVEAGGATADGKSILELLTLAAVRGSTLRIVAQGPDAVRAARE